MGKMMHISLLLQLTLVVIVSRHLVKARSDEDGDDKCIRLTAAFNYEGDVHLVSGNKYFLIDSNKNEIEHGTLKEKFYAPRRKIDAAFVYNDELYFFKGSKYFPYTYLYYMGVPGAKRNSSEWGSFLKSGLDAAATYGNTSYFFHGCEYAKGHDTYEIGPLSDLGLPCHVDAAWNEDGKIYITLENNVWIIDEDERVIGPETLSDLVTLTSTSICPNYRYLEKVKDEHMYEKEHNCTIIDAAITFDDTVYLFNDKEYITLNNEGDEIDKANIFKWGGLTQSINAGVVYPGDDHAYFFRGSDYYKYFYGFLYNVAAGPRTNLFWGPFFEQGIDAAGNYAHEPFFFRGCEILYFNANLTISSSDLKLPCDVDAAFSRVGTLYVIKRNEIWTWRADGEVAEGPAPLTSVVNVRSWTVCPPEEQNKLRQIKSR